MKLVVFSKMLKELDVDGLIEAAGDCGIDGYDLCVRDGYCVNPDNAVDALPPAARRLREHGLLVAMVTAPGDLVRAEDARAEPLLRAMDAADVRLLKLGYFLFEPLKQDYWREVEEVRAAFERWQDLSRRHRVKICYHTHSGGCMGMNCGMLAHLVRGFDPACIGAYVDTGHLVISGEPFGVAVSVAGEHLSLIALKDILLHREERDGHGTKQRTVVEAGTGMVDWTDVFAQIKRLGYDGPLSVHCEFNVPAAGFLPAMKRETGFFSGRLRQAGLRE